MYSNLKGILLQVIKSQGKKVTIDVIEMEFKIKELLGEKRPVLLYREYAEALLQLESDKKIERIKSSRPYPRDTRVVTKYKRIVEKQEEESLLKSEILTSYSPKLKMNLYLKNIDKYRQDQWVIKIISQFLLDSDETNTYLSVNERSFQLFNNEKLLSSDVGQKILYYLGLTYKDLKCYETFEPFFHYGLAVQPEQNILIVENKDTFFTFKKLFLAKETSWAGINFSMLIYGEGNKITSSINYMEELGVPQNSNIYYFGDLDPEGIAIYHRLISGNEREIKLMRCFYIELWERRKNSKVEKKQAWNRAAISYFLNFFDSELANEMEDYLKENLYIPQEAVNYEVLRRLSDGTGKVV